MLNVLPLSVMLRDVMLLGLMLLDIMFLMSCCWMSQPAGTMATVGL
jgi:hypothetical protein